MKYTTLPYPILTISLTICQIKSLSLHFFSFQKVLFLSFPKQINFCGTGLITMAFRAKLPSHCFKVIQYGYETFQNVDPILHSAICSKVNTASTTKKRLL